MSEQTEEGEMPEHDERQVPVEPATSAPHASESSVDAEDVDKYAKLRKALEAERAQRAALEKQLKELERKQRGEASYEELTKALAEAEAGRRRLERVIKLRDLVDAQCEKLRDKATVDRSKVLRFAEMLGEDADLDVEVPALVADFSKPIAVKASTASGVVRADAVVEKNPAEYTTQELAAIAKVDMARFNAIMDERDKKIPFLFPK